MAEKNAGKGLGRVGKELGSGCGKGVENDEKGHGKNWERDGKGLGKAGKRHWKKTRKELGESGKGMGKAGKCWKMLENSGKFWKVLGQLCSLRNLSQPSTSLSSTSQNPRETKSGIRKCPKTLQERSEFPGAPSSPPKSGQEKWEHPELGFLQELNKIKIK